MAKLKTEDAILVRWFQCVFDGYVKLLADLPYRFELAFLLALRETSDEKVKYNLQKTEMIAKWKKCYRDKK